MFSQINDWQGVGYIVKDTTTGSGAYMISGGLGGGSSTSNATGMQIVELFKGAYGWIKDRIDPQTRNTIVMAASVYEGEFGLSDEEIQENIVQGTMFCATYEGVGKCTGLVIRAYMAAGIDLVAIAKKNGINDVTFVTGMKRLADKLNINNSVRTTNDPLKGDIIFWDNTWDKNENCSGDDYLTHAGIVREVDYDGKGTVPFIHASSSKGVVGGSEDILMNIEPAYRDNKAYNSALRANWSACVKCSSGENCPATATCKAGKKPNPCTQEQWDSVGKLSGQLFIGYGTIRNQ